MARDRWTAVGRVDGEHHRAGGQIGSSSHGHIRACQKQKGRLTSHPGVLCWHKSELPGYFCGYGMV